MLTDFFEVIPCEDESVSVHGTVLGGTRLTFARGICFAEEEEEMKKVLVVGTGMLALSACLLAGCQASVDTTVGDEKHSYEYNDESGKFEEVKEEDFGFDSSDEAIEAYWQAYADCSKKGFESCFPREDLLKDGAKVDGDKVIEEQLDNAEAIQDSIDIHVDDIRIESGELDIDDLDESYTDAYYVEKARLSVVTVPMTQDVDGKEYEVEDKYEITTARIEGRWYIVLVESLGADVVSSDENDDEAEVVSSDKNDDGADEDTTAETRWGDWCVISKTDSQVTCEYSAGVSDSFEVADGVTFDTLCDWFEEAAPSFNRETYRRVFSLYFGSAEYFGALGNFDLDTQSVVLGKLAAVATTVDKVEGSTSVMRVLMASRNIYIYDMTCPQYGECSLYYDDITGEMVLHQYATGNESEGQIKDDELAVWATAAELALSGQQPD